MKPDRVAGHGIEVKFGIGHLREHDPAVVVDRIGHQESGRLRHPLDDQRVGHQRRAGEVVVHVLLGQRHVLHGRGLFAPHELIKTIDPEPAH